MEFIKNIPPSQLKYPVIINFGEMNSRNSSTSNETKTEQPTVPSSSSSSSTPNTIYQRYDELTESTKPIIIPTPPTKAEPTIKYVDVEYDWWKHGDLLPQEKVITVERIKKPERDEPVVADPVVLGPMVVEQVSNPSTVDPSTVDPSTTTAETIITPTVMETVTETADGDVVVTDTLTLPAVPLIEILSGQIPPPPPIDPLLNSTIPPPPPIDPLFNSSPPPPPPLPSVGLTPTAVIVSETKLSKPVISTVTLQDELKTVLSGGSRLRSVKRKPDGSPVRNEPSITNSMRTHSMLDGLIDVNDEVMIEDNESIGSIMQQQMAKRRNNMNMDD